MFRLKAAVSAIAAVLMFQPSLGFAGGGAMVEQQAAPSAGLQELQLLATGLKFQLQPGERIQLSYPASCTLETIVGGTVTIGHAMSIVKNGTVARQQIACDATGIVIAPNEVAAAGVVMRGDALLSFTKVFSPHPVFLWDAKKGDRLVVSTEKRAILFERTAAVDGQIVIDTAKLNLAFTAGGRYLVALEGVAVEVGFQIVPQPAGLVGTPVPYLSRTLYLTR